jgi:hypothetical protein
MKIVLKQVYNIQALHNLKSLPRFILPALFAVCAVFVSSSASASEQQQAKQYYDASTVVVGGESNDFIIGKGEIIHIAAGHSIRLMPGTRIEAGGQVIIEAGVTAKNETAEERHSIVSNIIPRPFIYEKECSFTSLPDPEEIIASAGFANAVMPVPASNANKNLLLKKGIHNLISDHSGLSSNVMGAYLPILAWGERPETIKVLRT